jgi:CDGSH-type Zn-finger protein
MTSRSRSVFRLGARSFSAAKRKTPANNYAVPSTVPDNKPVRRVDVLNITEVRALLETQKQVQVCRCFASKTFPFCDGSHNAHNKATGDNVGPVVIIGGDASGHQAVDLWCETDNDKAERDRDVTGLRANNYGVASSQAGAGGGGIRVDTLHIDDIEAVVEDHGDVKVCRCWASGNFPFCKDAHVLHNNKHEDNAGPMVFTPAPHVNTSWSPGQ